MKHDIAKKKLVSAVGFWNELFRRYRNHESRSSKSHGESWSKAVWELLKRSLQKPVSRAELDALERKVAQHEAANRSPSGDRYAHLRARQMPTG